MKSRAIRAAALGASIIISVVASWWVTKRRQGGACPVAWAWLLDNPLRRRFFVGRTLAQIGLKSGERVLEVGPGVGVLSVPAARSLEPDGELICLDIQPGMLARLEQRLTWEGVTNAVAVLGDVTHTPFEPDSFDAAFLVTVLGEIPDRTAALRELHRVLKLGGRLSISEVLVDPDYQPHEMVRRLCAEAGFRPTDMHGNVLAYTANFVKA